MAKNISLGRWVPAKHLQALNKEILNLAARENRRLIVEMPPQHGKSELISHYTPAWWLGMYPDQRIILTSYEASFASFWGAKARDVLLEFGPQLFKVQVNPNAMSSDHWEIQGHTGVMNTAGVGGPITGKGADLLIIDDPIKNPEEAASQVMREKIWDWWQGAASTRIQPDGVAILVMTRWHKDDLAGRLRAEGGWRVLSMPAIATEDDSIGRKVGEALWPQRYSLEELLRKRAKTAPYYWAALYQQTPQDRGGNVIKQEWWRQYDNVPSVVLRIIQSWDTGFKKGQLNDFSVCTTWAEASTGYYLLDMWRDRLEFPELKRMFFAQYDKYRPSAVLVEDKASGQSLLQEIRRNSVVPVLPIMPEGDKIARAFSVTPIIESGRVFIPSRAHWLLDFISECSAFPNAEHDDIVDSVSQALSWLQQHDMGSTVSEDDAYVDSDTPTVYRGGLPSF